MLFARCQDDSSGSTFAGGDLFDWTLSNFPLSPSAFSCMRL
jgi:hypothetical protein